jgi:FAD/FMN-containing dehydrogenase
VQWGDDSRWLSLALDTFTDGGSAWDWREELYPALEAGWALHRDNETHWYVNATFSVEGPSVLSEKGIDLSPELNTAYGLSDDWWIGAALGGVFASSAEEGNRVGYGYITLWVVWLTAWLPNESDSLAFNLWAATNEIPDDDDALFLSLEYEFDLNDALDGVIGIGTDPISPWDHLGVYATAGLRWRF